MNNKNFLFPSLFPIIIKPSLSREPTLNYSRNCIRNLERTFPGNRWKTRQRNIYIYITLSVTTRPSFVPFYRGQAVKEISISPLFHFLCRRFRKKEKERDARRADETVSLFHPPLLSISTARRRKFDPKEWASKAYVILVRFI